MITRFFAASEEANRGRIERVLTLPAAEAQEILADLKGRYGVRHPDIDEIWMESFERVAPLVPPDAAMDDKRRMLIGAYFTMEYAVEGAALFNPSIVPAINQTGLRPGCTRFFMSLRATGEGHLSSIVFRVGVIDADNRITMEDNAPSVRALKPIPDAEFDTGFLRDALADLGALGPFECIVLDKLGESFSIGELNQVLADLRSSAPSPAGFEQTQRNMLTFARSNYRIPIPRDVHPSEVVIFPISERESRGIEDMRLVRFTEDDGAGTIYGTYTAYNGITGFPSLFLSNDLKTIASHTMAGKFVKNKGMALFPRQINGNYVMSGRLDGVNRYIMESDNVLVWNQGRPSETPKYWWEFSIIGNCGSPVETEAGWVVLTHGVGPMREYSIGALLLDRNDPSRVIGALREPLLVPDEDTRDGYVPNVVYSCGALRHGDQLLLPYGASDASVRFALVALPLLLERLAADGPPATTRANNSA